MINFIKKFPIFTDNISTLKETSKDTSKGQAQYMTDIETEVINFDKVKTEYANKLGLSETTACSVDAMALLDDRIAFIEFKNGENVPQKDLRLKVKDSLLMFCDVTKNLLNFTREHMDLYVICNKKKEKLSKDEQEDNVRQKHIQESEALNKIKGFLEKQAKDEIVYFCLKRFKWLYFHDVHTYTKEEFEKVAKKITSIC